MKKKIVLAAAAIGLGFSINASAGWNECRQAQSNAEYYCNYVIDNQQCSYWLSVVRSCGLIITV